MTAVAKILTAITNSVALPAVILLAGLVGIGWQLDLPRFVRPPTLPSPETVTIAPTEFRYHAYGQYFRDGVPIDPPVMVDRLAAPLTIMKYQVSRSDYARCVGANACSAAEPRTIGQGNVPVTGVNYDDAMRYADWLSAQTGEQWTLPDDRQWVFAAGVDFRQDSLDIAEDRANPALRWLANYEKEAARSSTLDRVPMPLGTIEPNQNGLADVAGNVWEWTQSCYRTVHVDELGRRISETSSCTIKMVAGEHRAPISYFVRDARGGGCSVGVPPANLGFRLVRRSQWYERLTGLLPWSAAPI
ncbi:SUMF1/EgtB/PvdO family nonheme iron enzyme [Devosia rhodophyticola]|uniref:SUMF1/EgtB/PvdO family nonheme iron enzyme n=1 Tax=Devosia rhodophyticola TaxID=3026423 RepID=A0ABY7YXF9_9HYPH|nr:SUMF1/EgtB/PvdO family nonheme iron enzyme [Devosia rhodophyticola]WDR05996.1 SUMF1/EgtB/PvdO family nonheme iron enzyme [Devosia rhodophyticola]